MAALYRIAGLCCMFLGCLLIPPVVYKVFAGAFVAAFGVLLFCAGAKLEYENRNIAEAEERINGSE